ncbi:uncharacterized protein LOC116255020 isoform X1 [Nymphaea colorata]|nr:uncharacterized protein LOC116255020 isoform X1 [Nymphaea colorata]
MVTIAASLAASQWASLSSSSTGHLPAAPGQRLSARFVAPQLATDIIVVVEEVKFHLHKVLNFLSVSINFIAFHMGIYANIDGPISMNIIIFFKLLMNMLDCCYFFTPLVLCQNISIRYYHCIRPDQGLSRRGLVSL